MAPPEPYPCAEDNQRKPKKKPQEHLPDPVSRSVQRTNTRLLGRQCGRAKLQMGSRGFPRPESGADRSEAPPCRSTTKPPTESAQGTLPRTRLLFSTHCPRRVPPNKTRPPRTAQARSSKRVQRVFRGATPDADRSEAPPCGSTTMPCQAPLPAGLPSSGGPDPVGTPPGRARLRPQTPQSAKPSPQAPRTRRKPSPRSSSPAWKPMS